MAEFDLNKTVITDADFCLVQADKKITDKKLDTKPTTFMKDALKRFRKNKSSVVAFFILAVLILMAIFVPVLSTNNIKQVSKQEQFLAPKIFEAGFGWWDGTRTYERKVYDRINEVPAGYYKPAVLNLKVDAEPTLIDSAQANGFDGMIMLSTTGNNENVIYMESSYFAATSKDNYQVSIKLVNEDSVLESKLGTYSIYLVAKVEDNTQKIPLNVDSTTYETLNLNLSDALKNAGLENADVALRFEVKGTTDALRYILIENIIFTASDTALNLEDLEKIGYTDATKMVLLAKDEMGKLPLGYWNSNGRKGVHNSKIYYCDFVYDTYAAVYDSQEVTYALSEIKTFVQKGYCKFDEVSGDFEVLDEANCPIVEVVSIKRNTITGKVQEVIAKSPRYKKLGYTSMPRFIFGTDSQGHDIFKKAFAGLRTSLILGVCTAAFCFAFGLVWGSVSGYFGGNVDLIMERFCEILSGVPWIVVMTLCILKLGNNFTTFFLALCLTGWMGTAGRTRTQFYRFKGREYVLASRTLGASDMRLIFKHILPNSLGTIITSSVLMIPSVIFSEATLAYLHLGLQGTQSFGVMMSENQQYLNTYPNLVIFPAVIIALMMISFNLFGNGLRDAVNPSLKGSE